MVKEMGFGVRWTWVGILALLLANCMTLGELLILSENLVSSSTK